MKGTTPPMGQKLKPMADTAFPACSLKSGYFPPWTGAARLSNPTISTDSLIRSIVTERSDSAVGRSAWGEVAMSRGTRISLPMLLWNPRVSRFVIPTSPYTDCWNAPESVMMTPEKPRTRCSPFSRAASLNRSLVAKM